MQKGQHHQHEILRIIFTTSSSSCSTLFDAKALTCHPLPVARRVNDLRQHAYNPGIGRHPAVLGSKRQGQVVGRCLGQPIADHRWSRMKSRLAAGQDQDPTLGQAATRRYVGSGECRLQAHNVHLRHALYELIAVGGAAGPAARSTDDGS